MVNKEFFMLTAFTVLAFASEIEDAEQKKRGAGKPNSLNSIPAGVQKTDFTYNIYSQNPSPLSGPSQSYENSVPNSFYPSQSQNQQYISSNSADSLNSFPSSHPPQNTQSHFVPINLVPNPSYQTKYQILSQKPNGHFVMIPSSAIPQTSMIQYTNPFYNNPNSHIAQGSLLGSLTHGPFTIGHNYHPLTLGGSLVSQPAMVVIPQPHSSLYSNLVYPNAGSSLYSYYPSNSQAKYTSISAPANPYEYEKVQASISQSKEENGIGQNSDYASLSNANSAYNVKNIYSKT